MSTGNPLIDLLARGLGDFYSGQINIDIAKTPSHAIKYLVCDSGLSDEELGAFFAAGGSGILNRSEYFETFRAVAGVEIEPPVRSSYGEVSVREARIENGMRLARALRAAPTPSSTCTASSGSSAPRTVSRKPICSAATAAPPTWSTTIPGEPAKLSDLATEEGLERFREHKARFMEAAKLAVPPVDPDRVAALERLESRLEAVQPVKLVPGQIACQLGSSWVPASVIRDFALETFKIGYGHESRVRGSYQTAAQARGLEVRYSEVSGRWSVTSASGGMDESVAKKWGVGSYNCFMILTAALNGGLIQIEKDNPDYNPVAEKSKKKIPDPVATAAANAKRRELEEAFREWVWKDEDRAAMLADIYNRKLNRVAPRAYSGDYLSLPGMSPDIQLRKHQRDAVARIIQDGEGTLIAHTVGAGKTFTGITAMHELKRLGRARKPDDRRAEQPHRAVGRRLPQALPRRKAARPHRRRGEKPRLGAPVLGAGGIGRLGRRHRRIQPLRKTPDVIRCAEGGAHGAHRRARGIQTHGAGGRRRGEGLLGQADRGRARQVQEQAPVAREAKRIQDARGRDVRGGRLRRDLRRRGPLLQEPRGVGRIGARHADERRRQVRGPSDEVRVPAR